MKTIKFFIFLILVLVFSNTKIYSHIPNEKIYNEQVKLIDTNKLNRFIPKESINNLKDIGIEEGNFNELLNLKPEFIFNFIIKIIKKRISLPLKCFFIIVSIMLICMLVKSIYPSINNLHMTKILNSISTLSICLCIINPAFKCINFSSCVIKIASNFIIAYAPIMATLMISSGQTVTATSFHALIISSSQIISYLSETLFIPLINIILSISIISSISSNLKLEYLCKMSYKVLKSILKFVATIFTSIITIQNIISSSSDSITKNAFKFAISGCVPVIGNTISDAFSTVQGSLKLLKSSVGVFGIISGGIIFLPELIECSLWVIFLGFAICIGNIFELKKTSFLLKSISDVMSSTIAILVFSMVILLVSTAVTLVIGGS